MRLAIDAILKGEYETDFKARRVNQAKQSQSKYEFAEAVQGKKKRREIFGGNGPFF
jgi:hypothetical protein